MLLSLILIANSNYINMIQSVCLIINTITVLLTVDFYYCCKPYISCSCIVINQGTDWCIAANQGIRLQHYCRSSNSQIKGIDIYFLIYIQFSCCFLSVTCFLLLSLLATLYLQVLRLFFTIIYFIILAITSIFYYNFFSIFLLIFLLIFFY